MNSVIMMSGGLDSVAAWWATGKPAWLFASEANYLSDKKETAAIERLCSLNADFASKGKILDIDLSAFRPPGSKHNPRSYLFVMLAVGQGFDDIWQGMHAWDNPGFQEIDEELTNFAQNAFSFLNRSIVVRNIASGIGRVTLVQKALEAGCSKEFLRATWSCQWAGDKHCGACENCIERALTFKRCGIEEDYINNPFEKDNMNYLLVKANNRQNWDFIYEYKLAMDLPINEPVYIDNQ